MKFFTSGTWYSIIIVSINNTTNNSKNNENNENKSTTISENF